MKNLQSSSRLAAFLRRKHCKLLHAAGARVRGEIMRHLGNLLLLVAIATLSSLTAQAQATCADWAKATAWQGSYQLNGNGTATNGNTQFNIQENSSANVNMNGVAGSCPGILFWSGTDSNVSATVNDMSTTPCPPPSGGSSTVNATGTTLGSTSYIKIDTSNGVFM